MSLFSMGPRREAPEAPPRTTYAERRAICAECPNLVPGAIDKCGLCGCPVASRALRPGGCSDTPKRF